ncbi:MAG: ABC transporter substrate-binding protein [Candidatus Thermoplasmatota archaeon]|nr:ABC transporter substrate-binding protein [Candidatus Thermoplasmatota archaeon]
MSSKRRTSNKVLVVVFSAVIIATGFIAVWNNYSLSVNPGSYGQSPASGVVSSNNSTFIVGWSGTSIDTLNPYTYTASVSDWILMDTYSTLALYNANGSALIPELATSWNINVSNGTAIVHLNPNAKFSNGQPINSSDVAYSYEMADCCFSGLSSYVCMITNISTPNPQTVIFNFTGGLFPLISLDNVFILPESVWENVNVSSYFGYNASANPSFVGSGPFIVSKYVQGQYIELSKNPYWYLPNMEPHVSHVIIQCFNSESSMFSALQSGAIDATGAFLLPSQIPVVQKDSSLSLVVSDSFTYCYLAFNVNPSGGGASSIRNLTVRQAIVDAINDTYVTKVAWDGYATPLATNFPVGDSFLDSSLPLHQYNVSKANSLLNASGFKYGSNGIRVTPNGTPLSYTIIVPSSFPALISAGTVIKQELAQIGISITISSITTSTMDSIIWPGYNQTMDLWDWSWTPGDPTLLCVFTGTAITTELSDSGFNNTEYNNLYSELVNANTTQQVYNISDQLQTILYDQLPYMPLYSPPNIAAYSNAFTNISSNFAGGPFGAMDWQTFLQVEPNASFGKTTHSSSTIYYIAGGVAAVLIVAAVVAVVMRSRRKED